MEPKISLTTTFERKSDDQPLYTYTRSGNPNITKVEDELKQIMKAYCITYSSGMSALIASLIYYRPKRIHVKLGYYFSITAIELLNSLYKIELIPLEYKLTLKIGDLILIENPVNPTGEVIDINHYINQVKMIEKKENIKIPIICDATLAPPPLFFPLDYNIDLAHYSATKHLGGHSDILAGLLVCKDRKMYLKLLQQRNILGSILGNLEAYLLSRSLKTLKLRVNQQWETTQKILYFLNELKDQLPYNQLIFKLKHASIQPDSWAKKYQIHSTVFSILFQTEEQAKRIPYCFQLIKSATSIGGSITLMEWRYQFDKNIDPTLVRVTIGLEEFDDLKKDILNGFNFFLNKSKY
ncbi:hypothetical protein K502DRAFT_364255 [Neoconidiobolus thromboides FSU 785]|nr:hypothetical protein K502DRAFT_364255 [Neoconidiobolus thromboides FSU 785]